MKFGSLTEDVHAAIVPGWQHTACDMTASGHRTNPSRGQTKRQAKPDTGIGYEWSGEIPEGIVQFQIIHERITFLSVNNEKLDASCSMGTMRFRVVCHLVAHSRSKHELSPICKFGV